jgi:hypothetical protein
MNIGILITLSTIYYSKTCINRPPLGPKNMAGIDSWPVYSDMQMTRKSGEINEKGDGKGF